MKLKLHWFLPLNRKAIKGTAGREPTTLGRAARALLPSSLFSDPHTGRPGLARRVLKAIGPSWRSSPTRRIIQGGCFIAFLVFFFWSCWPYTDQTTTLEDGWPAHYADHLEQRSPLPPESFLALDPLVSFSTALAAKTWVWSLAWAGVLLVVCVFIPRGFCGYICPLGTLIDLFDATIGKRITRFRIPVNNGQIERHWWVNLKYYLLAGTLVASVFGVLISGFVAAIPVITRGLLLTLAPLQTGAMRGWHQVPPIDAGHVLSIVLFFAVLGLGLLRPRFWCRYVCPSGAIFSVFNRARATSRRVDNTCVSCNKCVEVCPFDAINEDYSTRGADCTFCQTCGGVCPIGSIKFMPVGITMEGEEIESPRLTRRGLLGMSAGVAAGVAAGAISSVGIRAAGAAPADNPPIRPPGSVPEEPFRDLCIRCGECFKACPNDVLQPMGIFEGGLDNMWTPQALPDWSGCDPSCNNCGQVCPTGAIRALPLEEKRVARMGLAIVNEQTCLPIAGREACQLCVDECAAAGYDAIEFMRVGTEVDEKGYPIEDSGFLAPVVINDKCVGCGVCQTRCYKVNVEQKGLLEESAIVILAGEGREDRMMSGSYIELREKEAAERESERRRREQETGEGSYLPDFLAE